MMNIKIKIIKRGIRNARVDGVGIILGENNLSESCEGSNEVSHKDMHRQGQSIPSRSSQHKDTKEKFPKYVALLVEKTNNR